MNTTVVTPNSIVSVICFSQCTIAHNNRAAVGADSDARIPHWCRCTYVIQWEGEITLRVGFTRALVPV